MLFAFARRAALGFAVTALAACSVSNGASAPAPGGGPASDAGAVSVDFDQSGVLTATPLQAIALGLHVTGPDTRVSVLLSGDYADASLSDGDVMTAGGHASVTLHAPSVPATFTVVAR